MKLCIRLLVAGVVVLGLQNQSFAEAKRRAVARTPAYQGNFAALERGTLENILFKVTNRQKVDFTYLTIAMNCTSELDGLEYGRSFQLADRDVRPFAIRTTRGDRLVATSNFDALDHLGPRSGTVDIAMHFSGHTWTTNIQVQAVGTDFDTGVINERCLGITTFHATKTLNHL